jgi:hypothetical protein
MYSRGRNADATKALVRAKKPPSNKRFFETDGDAIYRVQARWSIAEQKTVPALFKANITRTSENFVFVKGGDTFEVTGCRRRVERRYMLLLWTPEEAWQRFYDESCQSMQQHIEQANEAMLHQAIAHAELAKLKKVKP